LIGEIPLSEKFDVGRYREMALARVREIEGRGKRAIVVGGTGLYVRALVRGLAELPGENAELRGKLERLSLAGLQEKYAGLDPVGFERIDRKNRRRLVRAIEVSILAGKPFSSLREDWGGGTGSVAGAIHGIVLERDRDDLYRRIDVRVRRMFADGVIEEVRSARDVGVTAGQAIGYAEIRAHMEGKISVEECMAAIRQRTRRYAKRQLTWLRGENNLFTINLTSTPHSQTADEIVRRIVAGVEGGEFPKDV
jgi:tRNA dimethylallyltransferase